MMCVCVCDKIDWMENGWMDWIEWMWKVDGKWMWKVDVESGKWKVASGSGSHTISIISNIFPISPFISVHFPFKYFHSTFISTKLYILYIFHSFNHLPFLIHIYLFVIFPSIYTFLRHCFFNIFLYFGLLFS